MNRDSYMRRMHDLREGDVVELYRKPTPEEGARFHFRWCVRGIVETRWALLQHKKFIVQYWSRDSLLEHDVHCDVVGRLNGTHLTRWALPFTCIRKVPRGPSNTVTRDGNQAEEL